MGLNNWLERGKAFGRNFLGKIGGISKFLHKGFNFTDKIAKKIHNIPILSQAADQLVNVPIPRIGMTASQLYHTGKEGLGILDEGLIKARGILDATDVSNPT